MDPSCYQRAWCGLKLLPKVNQHVADNMLRPLEYYPSVYVVWYCDCAKHVGPRSILYSVKPNIGQALSGSKLFANAVNEDGMKYRPSHYSRPFLLGVHCSLQSVNGLGRSGQLC